ncbi:MAG: hypothetical protein FJ100_23230 [Deltaproteobacteria bacterium]|nr:hypothetical protein [Deltaproteobacteria bacterium]
MASAAAKAWVVCLEIKRIQTWLFAVPKLQAMVGANAILAKLLSQTLVAKAEENGAKLPAGVDRTGGTSTPKAIPGDPLADWDRPLALADDPVLVRHAGRFHVVFLDFAQAEQFVRAAAVAIAEACGDVLVAAHIEPLTQQAKGWLQGDRIEVAAVGEATAGLVALESPLLQPCQASGVGFASKRVGGRAGARKLRVSDEVVRRREAFSRHDRATGDDRDLVKRFYQGIPGFDALRQQNDFTDLADGGYLGVLCADGNSVGAGLAAARQAVPAGDYFAQWYHTEAYFLRTRSRIRAALATALAETPGLAAGAWQTPRYRLLMLGGDDILLVARADRVLELAARMCKALDALNAQSAVGDSGSPTTVGVGVAIVHPKFPFRRAHELAEHLMASAKRRSRTENCVDWEVVTAAALPDLQAQRLAQWVGRAPDGSLAIASLRPYTGQGLQRLVAAAKPLVPDRAATDADRTARIGRGQWRWLAEQMHRGMFLGELARRELRPQAREMIDKAVLVVGDGASDVAQPKPHDMCAHWYPLGATGTGTSAWGTPLLDLVEVAHIHTLGTRGVAHEDLDDETVEADTTATSDLGPRRGPSGGAP